MQAYKSVTVLYSGIQIPMGWRWRRDCRLPVARSAYNFQTPYVITYNVKKTSMPSSQSAKRSVHIIVNVTIYTVTHKVNLCKLKFVVVVEPWLMNKCTHLPCEELIMTVVLSVLLPPKTGTNFWFIFSYPIIFRKRLKIFLFETAFNDNNSI